VANLILRFNENDPSVNPHETDMHNGTGAEVVKVSTGLDKIGKMGHGETLYILGHGSPSQIDDQSASDIAKKLYAADFPSGINVVLVACNSGSGGAPFALALKMELVSLKILPASVTGGTNFMSTDDAGAPITVEASGNQVVQGTRLQNTPWGTRRVNVTPTYRTK
jgi:hypothetical protein